MSRPEPDSERLWRYVEGVFQRSGKTDFPTVRRCARSLGWSYARVEQAIEDNHHLMTTGWRYIGQKFHGGLCVESL